MIRNIAATILRSVSAIGGVDTDRANRTANKYIKERFTVEQLLGFYRQGLTLQDKLMGLCNHE